MALAAPKVSLHLYLNNPYGLLSATVPHYSVNAIDISSPKPKALTPLPDIKRVHRSTENSPDLSKSQSTSRSSQHRLNKSIRFNIENPKKNAAKDDLRTSQVLGITWSMSLNKREKPPIQRKSPPLTILDKLGKLKPPEPVGVIKVKRDQGLSSTYNVQKLQLADKRHKKMTEKLSEWLDQYNEVSQKQQSYLSRIKDLRKGLENKDEKRVIVTIDNMRSIQKQRHRRKYPLYTMSKMEDTAIPQGPAPFPCRPCLFHTEELQQGPKIKIAPRSNPRKLAPIIKKVNPYKLSKSLDTGMTEQSTSPEALTKMKTEYEPFESIARRNKLSLTQFFNSSLSHRRSNRRQPLNVSTVTIINEVADENEQNRDGQVDYITDLSARKSLSNKAINGSPD